MRRFVDDPNPIDAGDAILARVFRTVGPMPESEVARRRVLRAVQERGSSLAARQAASAARAKMAFAAGGLLVIGGVAGATVGRAAWDRLFPPAASTKTTAEPTIAPVAAPLPATTSTTISGAPSTALPAPAAPAVAPASPETAAARSPATPRRLGARGAQAGQTDLLLEPSADTALAQQAANDVRTGNPARARVLAEDYLARQPHGMVAEQMLYVLAAAAARNGDSDASTLAARYLSRYPSGQFAPAVRDLQKQLEDDADIIR